MPAIGYAGGKSSIDPGGESRSTMTIHFPYHAPGTWELVPIYMFWRKGWRRRNWRWTVDHNGCECVPYWEYK